MKPLTTKDGAVYNPERGLMLELLRHKRKRLGLTRHQLRNPWLCEAPAGTIFMFAKYKDGPGTHCITTVAWYNPGIGWLPMF
jgi:hypothetical protein